MLNWLRLVIGIGETGVRIKTETAVPPYTTSLRLPLESR
jgi:hypothetical protein